ncbi:MAG: oligosaccharide flippase family protein [Ruminococcus sp.]|nr:oligosaccharide flippase family protein [Ruminococcus sp.]
MKQSRTNKSFINTVVSFTSQFIIILLGFISRRVLIYSVGVEYLGINGLMTNILTIFSLAESGIGLAIGYALYKPLAENDIEKIKSLMRFFRNTYRVLAVLTALIGLVFYPFLPIFLKDNTAPNANLIYFMFLFSSVVSYLWVYKTTLNSSDQNKYLYTIANTVTQIVVLILKVVVLYFTENYIIYLAIEIGSTIIKNIIFSIVVDKRYPYLKDKNVQKLEPDVKKSLFTNIKALFFSKVGYILSQCSDNLVISSIVSVTAVGLYSNYTTLITSVSGFITSFTSGVTASMGNLIASESEDKIYNVYKRIDFINFWMYTFSSICLLCLTEPFIKIWLGDDYVLSKGILVVAVVTYYLKGLNSSVDVAKNAAGLYKPDRYIPMFEAALNLVISAILAYRIGLLGVLIGTLVSFCVFSFWTKPFFVCRDVFHIPFKNYVVWEGKKIIISFFLGGIIYAVINPISLNNAFIDLGCKTLISLVGSNLLLVVCFCKTKEFDYIRSFVSGIMAKCRKFLNINHK